MAQTAAKVCIVCNTDCSDRPRVKDELGRYMCKACADKGGAAPAAPKAAAPVKAPPLPAAKGPAVDDDGMDLRSIAAMEARSQAMDLPETQSCPKCHGFMTADQRLCMRCGFDKKRGAKVSTKVEKVKEEKEKGRHPIDVTWIVIGFGLLTVGCAASTFAAPVMALPALLLLGALGLGLYITIIACQFRDGETVYAVCSIVGLFIGFTSIVTLFWLFAVNDRGWLKGLWACLIISYVILIAAMFSNPELREAIGN